MSAIYTQLYLLLFRIWIVVIASAVIVLACLRVRKEEESQEIDDLRVVASCHSGTSAMLSSKVNTLNNAWSGSWRPLTNLTYKFRACHLCTFNMAAIFFRGHPYIWRTTRLWHSLTNMRGRCNICSSILLDLWQYIDTYTHRENRSLIQSLALMFSAKTLFLHGMVMFMAALPLVFSTSHVKLLPIMEVRSLLTMVSTLL